VHVFPEQDGFAFLSWEQHALAAFPPQPPDYMHLFASQNLSVPSGAFKKLVRHLARVTLLSSFLGVSSAFATNYYCNPSTGNINNPGTSTGSPWPSLQSVFSNGKTFAANDVIYLMNGNHGSPVITANNSGDVRITKYSGHDPVITKITFTGADHWVLDGVRVYSSSPRPQNYQITFPVSPVDINSLVLINGTSSYITIKNCNIYSATSVSSWDANDWNTIAWNGIYMDDFSHHLTIDGNDVTNTNFAIHMAGNTHNIDVRNCVVQNFSGDGIRANCDDLTIENNFVADCYRANENHCDLIQGFGRARVTIRNNYLINVTASTTTARPLIDDYVQGIVAFDGWQDDWVVENNFVAVAHHHAITLLGARNSSVVNNTVVLPPAFAPTTTNKPWVTIAKHKDGSASSGNFMRNNLYAVTPDPTDFPQFQLSGTTASNNLVTTSYSSHLVNYAGFDFRLKSSSSAVDAGTTLDAPSDDLNGGTRFAPYDIGCYEHPDAVVAIADSYTYGGSTSQNNGSSLSLVAKDGSGTSFDRTVFLKFDVSALGSAPTTATLILTPTSSTQAGTVYTRGLTDDSWQEGTITWANQPSIAGSNLSSANLTAGQTTSIQLNVSSFIQGQVTSGNIATIALTANDAMLYFKSRENSSGKPTLVFTQ